MLTSFHSFFKIDLFNYYCDISCSQCLCGICTVLYLDFIHLTVFLPHNMLQSGMSWLIEVMVSPYFLGLKYLLLMIVCHSVLFCLLMPAANQISKGETDKIYSVFFFVLKTNRHQLQPEIGKKKSLSTSEYYIFWHP